MLKAYEEGGYVDVENMAFIDFNVDGSDKNDVRKKISKKRVNNGEEPENV